MRFFFSRARPPKPLSRAERLRRRVARFEALGRRTDLRERAHAALVDFARRGGLRRMPEPGLAAAAVFERDAARMPALLRHLRTLTASEFDADSPPLRGRDLSFVRATLAFYAQDFARALREFDRAGENEAFGRSAAASRLVALWLRATGLARPSVLDGLRAPPPARKAGHRPVVLISDADAQDVALLARRLQPARLIVVAASRQSVPAGIDSAICATLTLDTDVERQVGLAARALADRMAAEPRWQGLRKTIETLATARGRPIWRLASEAIRLGQTHGAARIVVATSSPLLFETVAKLAAALRLDTKVEPAWSGRPRLDAGTFAYWPALTEIEQAHQSARTVLAGRSWSRLRPAPGKTILALSLAGPQDERKAFDDLAAPGAEHPAGVLIDGDAAKAARLQAALAAAGLRTRIYPKALFAAAMPVDGQTGAPLIEACAGEAAMSVGDDRSGRVLIELLGAILAAEPEIASLERVVQWVGADGLRIVGVQASPSVWLAGLAEHAWWTAIRQDGLADPAASAPRPAWFDDPGRVDWLAPVDQRRKRQSPEQSAAFCADLIVRGHRTNRAIQVLASLLARDGLSTGPLPETALPVLFERAAPDYHRMQRLVEQVRAAGGLSRAAAHDPDFAFVRGVLAFHEHAFARARSDLISYATSSSETLGGACAAEICQWLDDLPYHDRQYAAMMNAPAASPSPSVYKGRSLLVLTEASPAEVEPLLDSLPPSTRATVVYRFVRDHSETVPDGRRYLFPDRYEWYLPDGKATHKQLEAVAATAQEAITRAVPRLATIPWSVRAQLIDTALFDFRALRTFTAEIATGSYQEVLVITRRYSLYRTVRDIARGFVADRHIRVAWLARPGLPKAPALPFWPFKPATVSRQLQRLVKHGLQSRGQARGKRLSLGSAGLQSGRPAIVAWTIGDANYEKSLLKLVAEALRHRSVIVIAFGGDDAGTGRLAGALEALAESGDNRVQLVSHRALQDEGRRFGSLPQLAATAVAALAPASKRPAFWRRRQGSPIDAAFLRHDLAQTFVRSPKLGAFAALLDLLDTLRGGRKPAYVITAPGRSAFLAAAAEHLGSQGVPTLDVHLYFLADQARQMQPPHRYVATIDSQLAAFVQRHWKIGADRILKVGYLWADAPGRVEAPAIPVPVKEAAQVLIVYATQPSPPEIAQPVFAAVLSAISAIPHARLLVKPHPREEQDAISLYARMIADADLSSRVDVVSRSVPIHALFAEADVVVTRTSNAGLEAASRLKPLVRGVMHDDFLPAAFLNVVYAVNAHTHQELTDAILRLATDPQARAELRARQSAYFEENPSLIDGQGHRRIVDFLEGLTVELDPSTGVSA